MYTFIYMYIYIYTYIYIYVYIYIYIHVFAVFRSTFFGRQKFFGQCFNGRVIGKISELFDPNLLGHRGTESLYNDQQRF